MTTQNLTELNFLQSGQIKQDPESLQFYGKDWTTYFDIKASAVLFPHNTEDVQKIVQWAIKNKISLVPSGGRTGLSGAACALNGEVVVSFEKMNVISDFNSIEGTVRVQAGVVTEALQQFAVENKLFYPVDFAAKGSSHIGGNIATNAGGIKVLRYGLTRDWVKSLKVVTGRGEILEFNYGLVKNATGLDFRHLFIGSEGILGFITEATIQLAQQPPELKVMLVSCESIPQVMNTFQIFHHQAKLTAFEMFSDLALNHVMKAQSLPDPFSNKSPFYVVMEMEVASEAQQEIILGCFEKALDEGFITDGILSQSEIQAKNFWKYRETISESLSPHSPYKNDISVRVSKIPAFVDSLEAVLKSKYPNWEVVWFGHIGDGNLHINILRPQGMTKEQFLKECQQVDPLVFQAVKDFQGSISAEHGVGLTKKNFLQYSRSPEEINYMKEIKKIFDPMGIINPGKVI
ncbi:MAG: FAD-binding oxidoreductase [Pseudobdellovibrionaceae bacterium]